MLVPNVLSLFVLISSTHSQNLNDLFGMNIENIISNFGRVENAFGSELTNKIVSFVFEAQMKGISPVEVVEFLENFTPDDRENAAKGIITILGELNALASAPGAKDNIKLALHLLPMLMKQAFTAAATEPQATTEKPKLKMKDFPGQKNSSFHSTDDDTENVDTAEIRKLLREIGPGKMPDEFFDVVEEILQIAESIGTETSDSERLALDDKSTAKLSQLKENLVVKMNQENKGKGEDAEETKDEL